MKMPVQKVSEHHVKVPGMFYDNVDLCFAIISHKTAVADEHWTY